MSLAETLLQTHPEKFGLWPSVWKLLRLRWRVRVNTFKRSSRKSKIGTILLAVLLVAAMVGLFLLSRLVLNLLLNPALAQYVDPAQFINAIPTLILTAAFLITLMTNFSVLLQSLYLSHDMDFLVTSPIPMRAVFLAKLVEAILPTFGLFCAFSIPVLFGLGASSHYSFIYYPLLIVILILLALAAGGLASILVMGVVRVVPARRVAEVLGFFGAIASVLCGQSGNIIRQFNIQRNDIGAALTAFTGMNNPWFPLSWAGRGLVAVGSGEWLPGAALSLLTLAMGCVLFGGTLFLAEHLYYSGWASMQGSSRKKRAKNRVARSGPASPTFQSTSGNAAERSIAGVAGKRSKRSWIPSAVRGVIVKDLYLLRRDTRNLAQLITPLVLGFVMLFSMRGGGKNAEEALTNLGFSEQLGVAVLIGMTLFVGWILIANLANLAFSREGKNYWLIKTSPIQPLHLIAAKYIVSYLPTLAFCLVYLILASFIQSAPAGYLPYCVIVVALSIAGACGISLAYGTVGAKFDWDNPRRMQLAGSAGCMVVIVVTAYLIIDLLLYFLPVALWQLIGREMPPLAYGLGLVLGGIFALACVFIPLRLAVSRLKSIGENA